jgi:hypothetical protein
MLDFTDSYIEKLSVHQVGNKTNGEDLYLSKSLLDVSDDKLSDLLFTYFLKPFTSVEFYSFTFSNEDFTLNPIYNYALAIFESTKKFQEKTADIAKHLYDMSIHPQIKSGDLFVAYFSKVCIDDEVTDAIGIFKSENRQAFLKLNHAENEFALHYDDGINIEKLDKGCLIFNTNKEHGYKISIVDKSNKSGEAQFWKESFLNLKPCSDDYHYTKDFLNIAKNFVTKQLTEEFEVSKADQIDLLNKSVEYFKTHETFEKKEFEEIVFQDKGIIKSFRNFDEQYRETNDVEIADSFDVSAPALKKQAKIFKSVLKLDKNFHIYIHGDREMIEQGIDKDGRKFYKIYYKDER